MSTPHDRARVPRRALAALAASLLLASAAARAQGAISPPVAPGSRVRLHLEVPPETPLGTAEPRIVGTLVRVAGDSVVLRHAEDTVAYARSRVRRLDVSTGRTTRGRAVARNALAGLQFSALSACSA